MKKFARTVLLVGVAHSVAAALSLRAQTPAPNVGSNRPIPTSAFIARDNYRAALMQLNAERLFDQSQAMYGQPPTLVTTHPANAAAPVSKSVPSASPTVKQEVAGKAKAAATVNAPTASAASVISGKETMKATIVAKGQTVPLAPSAPIAVETAVMSAPRKVGVLRRLFGRKHSTDARLSDSSTLISGEQIPLNEAVMDAPPVKVVLMNGGASGSSVSAPAIR